MGRSLDISIPHPSRARQLFPPRWRFSNLSIRILLILMLLALLHEQHLFLLYRSELRAKYSRTEFETGDASLWRTAFADSELPRNLLANRNQWQVLGSGWEGKTFAFNGSVIKTFTPGQSPFRNCPLDHPEVRWPTEIPASLELGGFWEQDDVSLSNDSAVTHKPISGFLPVMAHFKASASPKAAAEWHLVTPLLPGGNLNNLAKSLRAQGTLTDFREVDKVYRPAFNRLLRTMESLHRRGFCHDDVKPSNVFVKDDTQWVLGDLGNVRHVSHPYHTSRLWIKDNSQLADCRANDAVRALKSYLQFIRAATPDRGEFDAAFFSGTETVSRLFWRSLEDAAFLSAAELRGLSLEEDPELPAYEETSRDTCSTPISSFFVGRRRALSRAVDAALQTKFSERAARWAALTWIFGVPVEEC